MGSIQRDQVVDLDVRSEARRGLAMYFCFIVAFEVVICTWAIARPQNAQLSIAVLMFTRHGRGTRFSDVKDNAFYWYFVVLTWLPIYGVIYWAPRLI